MRDDHQRLMDILEAIENIERYIHSESDLHFTTDDELLKEKLTVILAEIK